MSEQIVEKKEEKSNKKLIIIIAAAAFVVIAALVIVIAILLNKKEETPTNTVDSHFANGQIQYQQGIIGINQEDLQAAFDEAVKKVEEGYISLNFNNYAVSADGKSFDCYLGNGENNKYDVYYDMYLDTTFQDRIFITGLIPPGSAIDHFESEYVLSPGEYSAVLVLTQVEDDHSTIHAQTNVEIILQVAG